MTYTPCQKDMADTGREWAEEAPPLTVTEVRYMASLCQECPIREECYAMGEAGQRDMDGRWVAHSTGVWGGRFWRAGHPIDPLDDGPRYSIYARVYQERDQWRVRAQVGNERFHIGYFDSEDEAGVAADEWYRKYRAKENAA